MAKQAKQNKLRNGEKREAWRGEAMKLTETKPGAKKRKGATRS